MCTAEAEDSDFSSRHDYSKYGRLDLSPIKRNSADGLGYSGSKRKRLGDGLAGIHYLGSTKGRLHALDAKSLSIPPAMLADDLQARYLNTAYLPTYLGLGTCIYVQYMPACPHA